MKYFICTSVFLLCLSFAIGGTIAGDDRKNGNDISKTFWNEWRNVSVSFPDNSEYAPNNENNKDRRTYYYWTTLQEKCMNLFFVGLDDAAKNNQIEKFARDYVSYFGTEGDDADLRWCLACPIMASNNFALIKEGDPRKTTLWAIDGNATTYWEFTPEFKRFAREFNKAIIERSLESKDIYQRMYQFAMWNAEFPLKHGNKNEYVDSIRNLMAYMEEGFKTNATDHKFWFSVRWALILAYLCRQESIFNDVNYPPIAYDKFSSTIKPLEDRMLPKMRPLGDNVRMLFSASMVYSKDEERFVPVDSRLPPFDLPRKPFPPQQKIQNNPKTTTQHKLAIPKDIDPITPVMFNEIGKNFNTKFLEKVQVRVPMNK